MIIHDVEQGTEAWHQIRRGIPTASRFDEILTPKTGKLSASSRKYMYWLIAEKLLNRSLESIDNLEWVTHGRESEPDAVNAYEFQYEVQTKPVGFITSDDLRWGASPDRLIVGENGGLEVKCPAPQTMIGYMLDGFGDAYKVQVQGQMLVAELDWVDRFAWHPEMPPVRIRTYRDDAYIAQLRVALTQFCDEMDVLVEKIKSLGMFTGHARVATVVTEEITDAQRRV